MVAALAAYNAGPAQRRQVGRRRIDADDIEFPKRAPTSRTRLKSRMNTGPATRRSWATDDRGSEAAAGGAGAGRGPVLADSSVVVLALPEIYRELDTSVSAVTWVLVSFNL